MEIRWKNVVIALILVLCLINLPAILNNVTNATSSMSGAFSGIFGGFDSSGHGPQYDLARLCILFIFVLGVFRLLKNWKR
jgi:hypothetical protein